MNNTLSTTIQCFFMLFSMAWSINCEGQDLFISTYLEDAGNKCIEIFNPTDNSIDLSSYSVEIYTNGSSNPLNPPWNISDRLNILPAFETLLLCSPIADVALQSIQDGSFGFGSYNGDDAIVLKKNGNSIDIFGGISCRPSGGAWTVGNLTTQDVILARKPCITSGNTSNDCNFSSLGTEWIKFDKKDYSKLGNHNFGLLPVKITGNNALCEKPSITLTATAGFSNYKWSSGSNSQTATISSPGLYTVTVTTSSGCTNTAEKQINGASPQIFAKINTILPVSCKPKRDGGFTVSPSGGVGDFSFKWETGFSKSPSITGLGTGSYNVTVSDGNGCTITIPIDVGGSVTVPLNMPNVKGETCKNRSDGSIFLSAGGNGNLQFSIDGINFQNSGSFTDLMPGSYPVIVKDNTGCGDESRVTVSEGTRWDLRNSIVAQSKCQSEGGGQVILQPSGGRPPFSVSFDGNPFTIQLVFSNLKGGNYDIIVKDASGCEKSFEQIIDEGSDMAVDFSKEDATCVGLSDGTIFINTIGGTGFISYNIDDDRRPYFYKKEFKDLSVGEHTVTVRDSFDCRITEELIIGEKFKLKTSVVFDAPCSNEPTGQITILPQNGEAPYQYSIDSSGFADNNIFKNLTLSTHAITTIDNQSCTRTDTVNIESGGNFNIVLVPTKSESCSGYEDGQLTIITNSLDDNPVEYSIDGKKFQALNVFSGLPPKDYTIYARSSTCMDSSEITILKANPIVFQPEETKIPSCGSDNDGQIKIFVTGGKATYEYQLNDGNFQSSNTFTNLMQGDYKITVRDSNQCEANTSIPLYQSIATSTECSVLQMVTTKGGKNGIAKIEVLGGKAPFNIQLLDANFNNRISLDGIEIFEELAAGTYVVEVSDQIGCKTSCEFTIEEGQCDFSFTFSQTNVSCFDFKNGSIELTFPNGISPFFIDWSNNIYDGQKNISGLPSATYQVSVKDHVGCADTSEIIITQPTELKVEIVEVTAICEKDSAQLILNNQYNKYLWSNGVESPVNTVYQAGTYQVTVTDEIGCSAIDSINISSILQDTIYENFFTCKIDQVGIFKIEERGLDGCMDIFFRTYKLARKDTTLLTTTSCDPSAIGVTSMILSNAFNCDSLIITTTELLPSDTTYLVKTSCDSDQVGIRELVLRNQYDCDSLIVIETTLDEAVDKKFKTEFTCIATEAIVDTLTLKNKSGCDSLIITRTILNPSNIIERQETTCEIVKVRVDTFVFINQFRCDSQVIVNTVLAEKHFIEIAKQSCNPQDTGFFRQNLVNQSGCDSIVETRVTIASLNDCQISFTAFAPMICKNEEQGTINFQSIEGNPPFNYFIINENEQDTLAKGVLLNHNELFSVENLPVGNYTINLVNQQNISSSQTISILQFPAINISATTSDYNGFEISCESKLDGSILANVSSGQAPYSFIWNTGATENNLQNLATGNYTLTVTDDNNCINIMAFNLNASNALSINYQPFSPNCFGDDFGRIVINNLSNVNGSAEYSLDGTLFQPIQSFPLTIDKLPVADYQLFIQDENDCQLSEAFKIPMPNENRLTLGKKQSLILGDSLTLKPKANFEINQYEWTSTSTIICADCPEITINPTISTNYKLTAYDENGCSVSHLLLVNVRKENQVYIPSAFSPNEDGNNDLYQIFTGASVSLIKSLKIFDYEGRKMYQEIDKLPDDPTLGWDGIFNGQKMLPAVFIVFVKVELLDGTEREYVQTMNLVR